MRSVLTFSAIFATLVLVPALAVAQWSDNFDGYANGSPLHGQGGWVGWGGAPTQAFVTNAQARSVPHSADIRPNGDIVQQFTGVNSGQWVISAYCYIPAGIAGSQYFILLNTYPAGPASNWSCQVLLDMTANTVKDFDNPSGPALPMIRGQWVEVRTEIDFALDFQRIFYNNALLNAKSWTAGTAPGGALNLAALDLYSDNAPSIYWDDCRLARAGATAVEPSSWGQVKAIFNR